MEDFGKDLLCDIEDKQYGMYIGHNVVYLNEKLIKDPKVKYTVEPVTQEVAAHFYYVAKNTRELSIYDRIIREKVVEDFGDNSDGSNRVTVASDSTRLHYCVVASEVDYSSQDVIQPDFSIKHKMEELATKPNRMNYFYYYSDLTQTMKEIGIYDNTEELKNNLLEDMVKANQMGYLKENKLHEDSEEKDKDKYKFYLVGFETDAPAWSKFPYLCLCGGKTIEEANQYLNAMYRKYTHEAPGHKITAKYFQDEYSVSTPNLDFSKQDFLDLNFTFAMLNGDESWSEKTYLSDVLKNIKYYKTYEELKEHMLEDFSDLYSDDNEVEECCCAGGMGGGVTTASFAPAVTHTVYPRPGSKKKKKKKSKKESDETLDDIYGFYYCTIYVWIDFYKTGDIKTIYFRVFGKNLDEIDKYNQQINNNIKIIGSDSRILQTTLSDKYFSIAVKDFDFDNQKILDPNLYKNINTPSEFEINNNIIQNDIDNISSKVLSDYTNNLADFTSDLFTKMTEDTDDVYWPVRNDETDAFEQEIRNQRQAKKDKIIARKEKTIEKRNQTLANWIARVGDTMDLVKMKSMIDNYNKTTAKHIMELERIKKLPIDSPEFL